MQTQRFADAQTVQQYPLDIPGTVRWLAVDGGWRVSIPLRDLPKGTIVTPSLSVLDDPDYRFQFTLRLADKAYPLPPVPCRNAEDAGVNPSDSRVRTAIDCFHLLKNASDVELVADCFTGKVPERYLLSISSRPTKMTVAARQAVPDLATARPPARSQMLENPRIARRICSPVSTAMTLRLHRPCVDYGTVISACFDPVTRMYGMWPLAIRAASRFGVVGAVELFSDWDPVLACLEAGLPVVASIRYANNELPGAPLRATGGHLVVVHGVNPDEVRVCDPAAPHHGSVERRYPLEAFSRAWFRYRGAAYILAP